LGAPGEHTLPGIMELKGDTSGKRFFFALTNGE
jgi:hypothetical protein